MTRQSLLTIIQQHDGLGKQKGESSYMIQLEYSNLLPYIDTREYLIINYKLDCCTPTTRTYRRVWNLNNRQHY